MFLVSRPEYVREVFERQCDIGLANLASIHDDVGDAMTAVFVTGTDLGSQNWTAHLAEDVPHPVPAGSCAGQRLGPHPHDVEALHPLMRLDLAPAR